ncbi:hypothetical protein BDV93DRAFT_577495 [Ceratobasidium sp. AG-I]|nr:hypothetical protein BDV93DRAFT_577495 [Ceratobasidium sp. AG-I]
MFSTTSMLQFATAAFRTVSASVSSLLEFEYQQNLCRIFAKMFQEGRFSFTLNDPAYLAIKNDVEASFGVLDGGSESSLPASLGFKSEISKARLRATYHHQQQLSRSHRAAPVSLRGSDAKNVALYPTAMQVPLGHEYRSTSAPCSTPTRAAVGTKTNADVTVQGAINMLNALVSGLDESWLAASGTAKSTEVISAPRMTRSHALNRLPSSDISHLSLELPSGLSNSPTDQHTALRRKETFETSKHNQDRLRATLARTRSIYTPGSCIRPSGHLPGSETRTMLHGLDGSLNVALYPNAMLVKLATYEGDDKVDSAICDPEEVVCGAIERLNALVNGMGYDWVNKDFANSAHRMQRGGSMESMCSTSTASTESHPITPLDQVAFSGVKC